MKVTEEFIQKMIQEAGRGYQNAIRGMAQEGYSEQQIQDWVDRL